MNKKYRKDLDKVCNSIIELLNHYGKSQFLSDWMFLKFVSFYYGNLIGNFFTNLTQKNVNEYKLPKRKIGVIRKECVSIIKCVDDAIGIFASVSTIDEKYYDSFKARIKKHYPEFVMIVEHIESHADHKNAKRYLAGKRKLMKTAGKENPNLNDLFMTSVVEGFVRHKGVFPSHTNLSKNMRKILMGAITSYVDAIMTQLRRDSAAMLREQKRTNGFYDQLRYDRWKVPIDLFECLIRVSLESGVSHRDKLLANPASKSYPYKLNAIVKIHARAVQIANEILTLLKAGYPDGANARWRSLHELAVIAFFLKDSPDGVSQRYLEHETIRIHKDAQDYKTYYAKLGYTALGRKTYAALAQAKRQLCAKYADRFQDEYGWIPSSIIRKRNFRELEKHVKLDSLHPFYNLSCSAVHGGARGFLRLGLMKQDAVLHVGPSNYGLADPLQNAAASLGHVSVCLLTLESDFESLAQMQILRKFLLDIAEHSVSVQREIELDEKSLKNEKNKGKHRDARNYKTAI